MTLKHSIDREPLPCATTGFFSPANPGGIVLDYLADPGSESFRISRWDYDTVIAQLLANAAHVGCDHRRSAQHRFGNNTGQCFAEEAAEDEHVSLVVQTP